MSKTRESQMQVICFKDSNAYLTILDQLKTDEDFNGNNGDEYLSDKAKADGFGSNFEYYWRNAFFNKKHNKKTGEDKFNAIFEDFFEELKDSDSSYYRYIEFVLTNIGGVLGDYVLSVMYVTES